MRKILFWLLISTIAFATIAPVIGLIVMWPDLGIGRGLVDKRHYAYVARGHWDRGEVDEAVRDVYLAIKLTIASEIDWYLLQDDIDSFSELMKAGRYAEASQVCRNVPELMEYGPVPVRWKNFMADCAEAYDLHFNTAVLFCRDAGIWRDEAPGSELWRQMASYCVDYYWGEGVSE